MSYRGSFATEYIYFKEDFNIIKNVLTSYCSDCMFYKKNIISGKVQDLDGVTAEIDFENWLEEISEKIKHPTRIILFGETFTTYYKVSKDKVVIIYREEGIND